MHIVKHIIRVDSEGCYIIEIYLLCFILFHVYHFITNNAGLKEFRYVEKERKEEGRYKNDVHPYSRGVGGHKLSVVIWPKQNTSVQIFK